MKNLPSNRPEVNPTLVTAHRGPSTTVDGTLAIFSFEGAEGLHRSIIVYEQGAAFPAKNLLNKRSWLFREASRVAREVVR